MNTKSCMPSWPFWAIPSKKKPIPKCFKKYELIVHKFPDDMDAKLFSSLWEK